MEIIGDFLGLETHFFVDLNGNASEQYAELNGAPGYSLAEPFAAEPFEDTNGNGQWDAGERLTDWNGNGIWDADGGDFDGDGQWDAGEVWIDLNDNGVVDSAEPFTDRNHNGQWDAGELWRDLNGNGIVDHFEYRDDNPRNGRYDASEPWKDANGDGIYTRQEWEDLNGNGIYDPQGEVFVDLNNDGVRQTLSDAILATPNDDGDMELDAGLPRLAAEVILGSAPAACSAFGLPNRHTVDNAQAQFQSFLSAIGLGDILGIDPANPGDSNGWLQLRDGLDNGGCMRAYSPGYSYDPSDPLIMRRGGIEMIADLDMPNFLEDAHFTFDVSLPPGGLVPDFEATAAASVISAGPFWLPATGADGVNVSLRRETGQDGAATTTFGLGGTFQLLGLEFDLPYTETSLDAVAEPEPQPFFLSADQDGVYGRLQLTPPKGNNPLADGSWPVQLNGTFALTFDTRPATAGMTIELTDGTFKIPGLTLQHANASIQVDNQGRLLISNIAGDSSLLGLVEVTFTGGLTIMRPTGFGLPTMTDVSLAANVQISALPNIPQFAEAHGELGFQLTGNQFSGDFTGWGYILGVPIGSDNPGDHLLTGSLDAGGCLQTQFGDLQRTFSLPGEVAGLRKLRFNSIWDRMQNWRLVAPTRSSTDLTWWWPRGIKAQRDSGSPSRCRR